MKWFVECFKKSNVDEFLADVKIVEEVIKKVIPVVEEAVKEVIPVVKVIMDEIEG